MQLTSWANPDGKVDQPGLVGQIYFPFDSATLDSSDRTVLAILGVRFGGILLNQRTEFMFIGSADQRGNPNYNLDLGLRRATAVKILVDNLLSWRNNYSSWAAISFGESLAAHGEVTTQRLAEDRRVDIFCSLTRKKTVTGGIPKIPEVRLPTVKRLVYREFFEITHMSGPGRTNPYEDLGIKVAQDVTTYLLGMDNEVKRKRRTHMINALHRVNRIVIRRHEESHLSLVRTITMTTEITYEWGPAADKVMIIHHFRSTTDFRENPDKVEKTETISRAKADADPLLFPPNP